jgi:hypothetical protein
LQCLLLGALTISQNEHKELGSNDSSNSKNSKSVDFLIYPGSLKHEIVNNVKLSTKNEASIIKIISLSRSNKNYEE